MTAPTTLQLRSSGVFSLAESVRVAARAGFVPDTGPEPLILAFSIERSWEGVAVKIEQSGNLLVATVNANPANIPGEQIRDSVEHLLSVDHDGDGFEAIGARDPVIAKLQRRFAGLRPILFPSPYEAAARAIIGHRIPVRRAAALAARIAAMHGVSLSSDGKVFQPFPSPARLADLAPLQGLSERKVVQLRALGQAAADGWLDSERLRSMQSDEASVHLQQLAGIGPFSADLILVRGLGDADAFPQTELSLQRAMAAAYDLGVSPGPETLLAVAERWPPYRSWACLLLRQSLHAQQAIDKHRFRPLTGTSLSKGGQFRFPNKALQ